MTIDGEFSTPWHQTDRYSALQVSDAKKNEATQLYKQGNYEASLKRYSEAIEFSPQAVSYYNRCAIYAMMGKYQEALADSQMAVKLDWTFVNGQVRAAKCHLIFGDMEFARKCLRAADRLDQKNPQLVKERATYDKLMDLLQKLKQFEKYEDHPSVIDHSNQILQSCPEFSRVKLIKAEALVYLRRFEEANLISTEMLKIDCKDSDAIYIDALILYYTEADLDETQSKLQRAIQFAPDHKKCIEMYKKLKNIRNKIRSACEAFSAKEPNEALKAFTAAFKLDTQNNCLNSRIALQRSAVYVKLNKPYQALDDCFKAIELDKTNLSAFCRRAELFMMLNLFHEAIDDYEYVNAQQPSQNNQNYLDFAKGKLNGLQSNYYLILGVNPTANNEEIKKSYKKSALLYHPDRHVGVCDTVKRLLEKKFKQIGEAYDVLSDLNKRFDYDLQMSYNNNLL